MQLTGDALVQCWMMCKNNVNDVQKKAHFVEGISTRKYSSNGQRSQKNRQAKFRISVLGMIYGLFGDKDPNTRLFSQKKESNLNARLLTSF